MPPSKITKAKKAYHVKDETKRPMTVYRVRFHPTESCLLAVVIDRRLAVWDLDGEATNVKGAGSVVMGNLHCDHQQGWIRGCDVSRDGQWLATGGSDRRLMLWNWTDGKPAGAPAFEVKAHDGWVEGVAFAPDGKSIATVGSDMLVKLWQAADLKPANSLTGHTGIVRDVAWTTDGKHLLTGGEDGKVIVWDSESWNPVRTLEFGETSEQQGQHPKVGGVHRLACSRDNRWLAVAGDKMLTLFDLETGEVVGGDASIRLQGVYHPDADVLAAGGDNVKVWSYTANKLAPLVKDKNGRTTGKPSIPGKQLGSIKLGDYSLGIDFSADGKLLATGKSSGTVELWEVV